MEVVSQLCFSDGTPPSNEVVDKLLTYIIDQTKNKKVERIVSKELTIFDDSIATTSFEGGVPSEKHSCDTTSIKKLLHLLL
jgi:hypothetical protein